MRHWRNYRLLLAALLAFHPAARRQLLRMSAMVALISLANLATPWLLKRALDTLSQPSPRWAYLMVALYALSWAATQMAFFLKNMMAASVSASFERALSLTLLARLFRQTLNADTDQAQIGASYTRFKRSALSFGSISCSVAWAILPAALELCGAATVLALVVSPLLGAVLATTVLSFFIASLYSAKVAEQVAREINQETTALGGFVIERLTLRPTMRLMHAFQQEQQDAAKRYQRWCARIISGNRTIGLLFAAKIALIGLGLLLSLLCLTSGVLHGQLGLGDFVMVNAYVIQFALPMTYLAGSVFDLQKHLLALDEAAAIVRDTPLPLRLPRARAETPDTICFSVRGRLPLPWLQAPCEVDFKVESGQMLGLCGASGSGKSTLLDACLRLREFDGQIMLNQHDAREIDEADWRRLVGGVRQQAQAFQGSLRENIIYGMDPPPDEGALRRACYLSCLDPLIASRADGLDFQVAANGENLSGGERMRLAIARAVVRAPRLLLLDEPSAALDPDTEWQLMQRIRSSGMAVIVASHSSACLACCDQRYKLTLTPLWHPPLLADRAPIPRTPGPDC
jgi:ATP-binding cassette subfamily B protein